MASASKRRVDFISAEKVLEHIFNDEDSAEGMDSGEESDLDRQLNNETGESSEGEDEDDEQLELASPTTEESVAPFAGPSAPSATAGSAPPASSASLPDPLVPGRFYGGGAAAVGVASTPGRCSVSDVRGGRGVPAGRACGRPRGSARRGSTRDRAAPDVGQFKLYDDPDVGNAIPPFAPSRPVGYHFG